MAKAKVDFKGLEKFSQQLNKLKKEDLQAFSEKALKELAARLLRKVAKRTPASDTTYEIVETGVYKRGKKKGQAKTKKQVKHQGGTLRGGWTIGEVVKTNGTYTIEVINPVEYASYVEYGHRGVYVPTLGKTLHLNSRFTEGKFMLTVSEQELEVDVPKILEAKLTKFMGEVLNA